MQVTIPQFDPTQARAEGWSLHRRTEVAGALEIVCYSSAREVFDSDSYAEMEVYHRARDGSEYHRQALELVWHSERRPGPHPLDTPAGRVLRRLGAGYAENPEAFDALLADVCPAPQVLGDHGFDVTTLGLLNGVLQAVGVPVVAAKYDPTGEFHGFCEFVGPGVPAEYPDYPFAGWRAAVAACGTALGYADWVQNQRSDAAAPVDWRGLAQDIGNSLEETAAAFLWHLKNPDGGRPTALDRAVTALKCLDYALGATAHQTH